MWSILYTDKDPNYKYSTNSKREDITLSQNKKGVPVKKEALIKKDKPNIDFKRISSDEDNDN